MHVLSYFDTYPGVWGGGGGGGVTHREYSIGSRNEKVVLLFPLFYIHCIHDSTHNSMTASSAFKH